MNLVKRYAPIVANSLLVQNATTTQNEVYGATDLSQLNWLERTWACYYIYMGNSIIATGLMSFVLHEVSKAIHCAHVGEMETSDAGIIPGQHLTDLLESTQSADF
jgi:hypothetical protein